jgi:hypothetical protein
MIQEIQKIIMVRCMVLSVRRGRRDCINDVVNETKDMAIKHLMNFTSYSGPDERGISCRGRNGTSVIGPLSEGECADSGSLSASGERKARDSS